ERWLVVPDVAGSSPVVHPNLRGCLPPETGVSAGVVAKPRNGLRVVLQRAGSSPVVHPNGQPFVFEVAGLLTGDTAVCESCTCAIVIAPDLDEFGRLG